LRMECSSRSYEDVRALARRLLVEGRLIDALFLDGEKACFIDDYFTYRPWVRDGGLIFMHDVVAEPMRSHYLWACAAAKCKPEIIVDISECSDPPDTEYGKWLQSETCRQSCGVGVIRV